MFVPFQLLCFHTIVVLLKCSCSVVVAVAVTDRFDFLLNRPTKKSHGSYVLIQHAQVSIVRAIFQFYAHVPVFDNWMSFTKQQLTKKIDKNFDNHGMTFSMTIVINVNYLTH
jgi:hypothetical protein